MQWTDGETMWKTSNRFGEIVDILFGDVFAASGGSSGSRVFDLIYFFVAGRYELYMVVFYKETAKKGWWA